MLGSLVCITTLAMKSIIVLQKKKRQSAGRATEYDPITSLRMPKALKTEIEEWAKTQEEKLSFSKATCRLVEQALAAAPAPRKTKGKSA